MPDFDEPEVFISYATADLERVEVIAGQLSLAGVSVWLDRHKIEGATRWAEEIVRGIKACKLMLLMCSDASMRSWAVKQEIQLAGECRKSFLPIILEQTNFPDQMRFFLAGWTWIEVLERPIVAWMPQVLNALTRAGVKCNTAYLPAMSTQPIVEPIRLEWGWEGLKALARFTDQIWPIPADRAISRLIRSEWRDLGAPQDEGCHHYHLDDRIGLVIESDRAGHLLLLNDGTSGKIYCLCPSHFAPDTFLPKGRSILPQATSRYDAFEITGRPGHEQLLAIVTDEPLGLDWIPKDPNTPARVLKDTDIKALLAKLQELEGDSWTSLSSYFDIIS